MGYILFTVYVLPFLVAFVLAWKKNVALYIALAGCTLLASWALVAMYVTMVFGFLLPWVLLWYVACKMQTSRAHGETSQ
ncbi:MAG: hypothetical protein KDI51_10715 [Xanthomonadales bacterium]|nr:hypothetical protein [Xanthomonadales bacterium]